MDGPPKEGGAGVALGLGVEVKLAPPAKLPKVVCKLRLLGGASEILLGVFGEAFPKMFPSEIFKLEFGLVAKDSLSCKISRSFSNFGVLGSLIIFAASKSCLIL